MSSLSPNKIYLFKDLPVDAQNDFLVQFESDFDFSPQNYFFKLTLVSFEELTAELDEIFGPNLIDAVEDDYVIELANDILINGLKNPPIGSEGIHRALAYHYLGKDMFRFQFYPLNRDSQSNPPQSPSRLP